MSLARAEGSDGREFSKRLSLGVIVLVGALLRTSLMRAYALNPDELLQMYISRRCSLWETPKALAWEPHPALAFWIRHYLFMIDDSMVAQRALSLLSGVALIWVLYAIGSELDGKSLGLAAAALTAISPGSILLAQVSRTYALAQLLVAVSLWLVVHWHRTGYSRRTAIVFTGCSAAAFWTLYGAVIAVAGLDAALLWMALGASDRRAAVLRVSVVCAAQAAALGVCYFLCARYADAHGVFEWWKAPLVEWAGGGVLAALGRIPPFLEFYCGIHFGWIWTLLLLGGIAHLATNLQSEHRPREASRPGRSAAAAIIVTAGLAVILSAASLYPLGPIRQSSMIQPFITLGVAAGLVGAVRLLKNRVHARRAGTALRAFMILTALPVFGPLFGDFGAFPWLRTEFPVSNQDAGMMFQGVRNIPRGGTVITDAPSVDYVLYYDPRAKDPDVPGLHRFRSDGKNFVFDPHDWGFDASLPCKTFETISASIPNRRDVWFLHWGWPEVAMASLEASAMRRRVIEHSLHCRGGMLFAVPARRLRGLCAELESSGRSH